jgi:CRP-like cAMP-binding protein
MSAMASGNGSDSVLSEIFIGKGLKKTASAGQNLFNKGDAAGSIYYLKEGRVKAYMLYPDGAERTLCFVDEGNLVGEEAVATPPVRIVSAGAERDSVLYCMTYEDFVREMKSRPKFMLEIMNMFMKKITLLTSWIFYGQFSRNEEKIACLLYSSTSDEKTYIKYTHDQIASVTGMNRVSATKIIKNFTEKGLVENQYRNIRILDRNGLKKIFENKEFF